MAYKKIEDNFSFADIAINKNADRNRSLIFLRKVANTIDWEPVETLLMKYYQIGKSNKRESAYSPLLLFKCLLLQNWFQIKSDPELENLICDRLSFRDFLKLPMDYPSPDHSTFFRFRKHTSKEAMIKINSEVLKQFHYHGITINKGVAVDARLVKSASRPISKKQIIGLKEHLDTQESRLDKNGNLKKFSRDFESDWTIKNDKPHYGFKEHTSVNTENGFILSTTLSPSSHNDSRYLPYAVIYSMRW
ncbi:MAG: transposase [Desulfobacteraceae bacterium]|nr:transposase [Desulfobacteraceae bacterium]